MAGMVNGHCHQKMFHNALEDSEDPIVVVGFSLRFPQDATSPQAFWQMLHDGRSALSDIPKDRFNVEAFYHADSTRISSINFKGGHFVRNIAAFDAPFFSITPAEAASMDPQQRLLLETTYTALENAGISMQQATGSRTSVHVGCFGHEYDQLSLRDPESQPRYHASGSGSALLANRISWFYNLTGPSCESLRRRESDMVSDNRLELKTHLTPPEGLVAGCNLIINPDTSVSLSNLNFLSPDSRCYSFDHRANGYARGEGIGVILLKRLKDALRDGDTIRAVVRATGVNQDGRTPGITQPSHDAQEQLIRSTYESGGLQTSETRYFEAHGTGTAAGDPVEAAAIAAIFSEQRPVTDPLYIGAVKSNIGHLEGASGIAGLLKTILVLEKGVIPPNIWFECVNPKILAQEWKLKFPTVPTAWPASGLRRASVNSFGFGGANCHVIVDDAYSYLKSRSLAGRHHTVIQPPELRTTQDEGAETEQAPTSNRAELASFPRVCIFSAADEAGLSRLGAAYSNHRPLLRGSQAPEYLRDLAYTLDSRRGRLPWKSYALLRSLDEMRRVDRSMSKPIRSSGIPALGFIFSGQGAAWPAMGRELLVYQVFKESLRKSEDILQSLGFRTPILSTIQSEAGYQGLDTAVESQSLSTATQLALIDLLRHWGVRPDVVIGHSSGEIAAAYCVGGINRASALKIAYHRGALAEHLALNDQQPGAMASVALSKSKAEAYLQEYRVEAPNASITVACVNSPGNVTLSGSPSCIEAIVSRLEQEKIFARRLNVNVAYHSTSMKLISHQYASLLQDLSCNSTGLRQYKETIMISTVTGLPVTRQELGQASYWVDNLESPVHFHMALRQTCSPHPRQLMAGKSNTCQPTMTVDCLVEVGPHAALRSSIKETLEDLGRTSNIYYDSLLHRGQSATETALRSAGELLCRGYPVNLRAINMPGTLEPGARMLVDLPEYPFNHTNEYWLESEQSRNLRFRKHPRHELLGVTVSDWNELEPKWRNFLKLSDNPWIKDHIVNGLQLYPAAGMLVMVLEAVRQIAGTDQAIEGICLKNVRFDKALLVPSTDRGVETNLFLRKEKVEEGDFSVWSTFRICSYHNSEWVENCTGSVSVQYESGQAGHNGIKEATEKEEMKERLALFHTCTSRCKNKVNTSQLYDVLRDSGYQFGETFQVLHEAKFGPPNLSSTLIDPTDIVNKLPDYRVQDHLIHPTTLDGVLQSVSVILTRGGEKSISSVYPTQIQELWISGHFNSYSKARRIMTSTTAEVKGFRTVEAAISVMDVANDEICISIEGFRATSHATLDSSASDQQAHRRLSYQVGWKADIDLLGHDQLERFCFAASDGFRTPCTSTNQELELACLCFMEQAVSQVAAAEVQCSTPHLQKYYQWMEHQVRQPQESSWLHSYLQSNANMRMKHDNGQAFVHLANEDSNAKLICTVGRKLPAILRGEMDPLDLLFNTGLAPDAYQHLAKTDPNYPRVTAYLDAIAHKNPGMRILEIGAGTGGTTEPVLRALSHQEPNAGGVPRFREYTFTDISPSFFEKARSRFQEWSDRMVFNVLDVEKDPASQGYEPEAYDLVIAANVIGSHGSLSGPTLTCQQQVLHATANLSTTAQNTRRLLKPFVKPSTFHRIASSNIIPSSGGKLILLEQTNLDVRRLSFAFGILPGWWLSTEEYRLWSPIVTEQRWHEVLSSNGFSGTDLALRDHVGEVDYLGSLIVSTAQSAVNTAIATLDIKIVTWMPSMLQQQMSELLMARLQGMPFCQTCSILDTRHVDIDMIDQAFCVFLPELDQQYLLCLNEDGLKILQRIFHFARGILWVSPASTPDRALVEGLSRCVRAENSDLTFVTLAVEDTQQIQTNVSNIARILAATLQPGQAQPEPEYLERKQHLQIARVIENVQLNQRVLALTHTPPPQLRTLSSETHRQLKLSIAIPGLLESLQFVGDTPFQTEIASDEVEVRVHACGLNIKDVKIALGQITGDSFGNEFTGVILRVGTSISHLKPGARVCGIAYGAFRHTLRTKGDVVIELPDQLNPTTAAGIPIVYCTAYYAIFNIARMVQGESILVHIGADGFGQAAIQLAKYLKAEIFTTVGNEEQKTLLTDVYGIPSDHIFSSKNLSFARNIQRMTRKRGVDVVLNSLGGEGMRKSWECIAPLGRFIEIGLKDAYNNGSLPMLPFSKSATFASVNGIEILSEKPALLGQILRAVIDLFQQGKIISECMAPALVHAFDAHLTDLSDPHPQHVYRSGDIVDAFRYLRSGNNTGKTIIELHRSDLLPIVPDISPTYEFKANAAYVVAGGFGGIGRSISRWLVQRGARNLIVLSKHGPKSDAAVELIEEMRSLDVKIAAPACDIANTDSLSAALNCCQSMPPVKGCFQTAMFLKDAAFENLTLADFHKVIAPKVHGSWNLHSQLPLGMDFFVLLSSVAGVTGNKGQSNYACGNTYQDALGRYRTSIGEKAVSIDLSRVASVGFLAERLGTATAVTPSPAYMKIQESELHALLDHYCDPSSPVLSPGDSQLVIGIHTPADLARQGIDEPVWMRWPLFSHLRHVESSSLSSTTALAPNTTSAPTTNFQTLFRAATTRDALAEAVCQALVHRLAASLAISNQDIDEDRPMHVYGIDSLVAVEIRQWFRHEVRAEVAVVDVFESGSVRALSALAAERSAFLK